MLNRGTEVPCEPDDGIHCDDQGHPPATEYLKIKKWLTPNAGDAADAAAAIKPRDFGPAKDSEGRLNLNVASREDLIAQSGIGQEYADKSIQGRPFKTVQDMVSRHIMPAAAANRIRARIFVQ